MITLKLSVWRPVRLHQELYYSFVKPGLNEDQPGEAEEQAQASSFSKENLFEQIYSWSTYEDVWGGIRSEETRYNLRMLLLDSFSGRLPPIQRGAERMGSFLAELNDVVTKPEMVDWMACQQVNDDSGEEAMLLRISPTVALFHHLNWVHEAFCSVPSISFMVH